MTQTSERNGRKVSAGSTSTMVIGWTLVVIGLIVFVLGEPAGGGLLVVSGAVLHAGAMVAESNRR
ncbi:hypothetical protein [Arthrobacter sp. S41]|uniref:hypothetical protein n=1 Tax=Micrococcaceae TaxID=1268 RepID=UPI0010356DFE|nr:hypothetical protein [Arthrobacter sp. S41]TAP25926.1 hypothetical protein EYR88_13330 [Arthrobacter sp. S41]